MRNQKAKIKNMKLFLFKNSPFHNSLNKKEKVLSFCLLIFALFF
jgi:hypothetical protein